MSAEYMISFLDIGFYSEVMSQHFFGYETHF